MASYGSAERLAKITRAAYILMNCCCSTILVVVMRVSSSQQLMGKYVNGLTANILGWVNAAIMATEAIALFATGGVTL